MTASTVVELTAYILGLFPLLHQVGILLCEKWSSRWWKSGLPMGKVRLVYGFLEWGWTMHSVTPVRKALLRLCRTNIHANSSFGSVVVWTPEFCWSQLSGISCMSRVVQCNLPLLWKWLNKQERQGCSVHGHICGGGGVFPPETHRKFYQAQCEGHSSQTLFPLPCWTVHLMVSFQWDQRDHHIVFQWYAPSHLRCGQIH